MYKQRGYNSDDMKYFTIENLLQLTGLTQIKFEKRELNRGWC